MRVLCLDIGDRRIGVAVSDPLGMMATGLGVIDRKVEEPIVKIMEYVKNYDIKVIVSGLPKNMDGTVGFQGEKVKEFVEKLKEVFEGEVIFWDERLTTVSAHRTMAFKKTNIKKRKDEVDKIAACYILEGYMQSADFNKRKNEDH